MNKLKKFWKEFWQAKHRHAYTHSAEAIRHNRTISECDAMNQTVQEELTKLLKDLTESEAFVPMEIHRDGYDGKNHWKVKYVSKLTGETIEVKHSKVGYWFDTEE